MSGTLAKLAGGNLRSVSGRVPGGSQKIVKTFSMQSLADLVAVDERLRPRMRVLLQDLTETGCLAMQSRRRKLLGRLKGEM